MIGSNFYVSSQDDTPLVYNQKTSPCTDKKNQLGVYDAVLCGEDGMMCNCWHRAHRLFVSVCVCVCPSCCIALSRALSRLHCKYLGNFRMHMSDNGRCLEHLAFETFSKSAGDSESPEALVHDYHSLIYELNRRKKIDGHCKLVTRGVAVNPSGIALAFPHGSDMHIPFSKAILNLVAQDTISNILRSL